MQKLATLDAKKNISNEALVFVSTPKAIFKLPISLTPPEYFALAAFTLEKSNHILETFQHRLEKHLSESDLHIIEFAKQYTLERITQWSLKPISKPSTFQYLSMPQAVTIIKQMQATQITQLQQVVFDKIFQQLTNHWFSPDYFTQNTINID